MCSSHRSKSTKALIRLSPSVTVENSEALPDVHLQLLHKSFRKPFLEQNVKYGKLGSFRRRQ
eukprot:534940-Hanusia_phi.AAC.1